VAAIDKQAEKAAANAKAAEERVRALAQKGAPDAAMVAALRAAADAAQGTAGEAQARLALETALAKQGQAEQARRQAEDAQNDPRLLELARRLAEAGAEPAPAGGPAPVAPAGPGRLGPMSEEAQRAMAQANGLAAEADRLKAVAEQAGKDGGEGAENLLRQAQEAERKAQEAMEHAQQLQKRAERELLGLDQPSGTPAVKPPSQEEQVRALGDWARRLEEEARGLVDGVNDLEAQARAAEAAGDPERAIALRDQMPEQKESARIALERSAAAQEALRALMQALGHEGR
jgi:hypothetical protein